MQQEARNTETHQRSWAGSSLRHKAVQFVSAGSLEPTLEPDKDQTKLDTDREEPKTDHIPDKKADIELPFFFDSKGQGAIHTEHPDPVLRSKLSDIDDSSEDEVVFTGRRNTKPILIETNQNEIQEIVQTTTAASMQKPHTTLDSALRDPSPAATPTGHPESDLERPDWPLLEETDPLADYIANIDNDYHEEVTSGAKVDLEGGIDVEKAASQLDLSPLSPTGSKIESPRSLAQMQIDTGHESLSTSSEDDEGDMVVSGSDDDNLEDFVLLDHLANGYSQYTKKGSRHGFPSASALADALESDPYFGFDIMDFDRPSLRKKSKGKKSVPDPVLSDSEFEIELQEAWQNDRTKKRLRKMEREELRAQGLLGRKAGNPDLKVKYPKEMNMEEFMTELRSFLMSAKNRFVIYLLILIDTANSCSLSLPPMTKQRRKLIHELANALNLKSQSRGHGLSRFPVLNKTTRTPRYTSKTISNVDELLSGRKFNRRLFKSWGTEVQKFSQPRRGKSGAASYMDGDVVGASAPEIGAENRGRAMLEKMGWSTGTALGAADNKGILQPVAQVVKNSRAGLG
ncbi:Single-stranded nucleic acid binding R3H [Penicillium griseofulvum]|uniref:Single-stranded nucleic acid binding R3H n=1 Tax=Penicillium patulum TaxID=5078 RepID=A0A135LKC5_PENPA|nr:Single-stranded nucleic acid binding R3H [Penicillium griseofulvum]KXG49422.1 Single-stranded nucleic acid binding R3H [Penicillium griseofulvum]